MKNWSTKGLEDTNMETEQCKNVKTMLINMYYIRKMYNEVWLKFINYIHCRQQFDDDN